MNSYEGMATRLTNAENSFIEAVQEQFGKSEAEAEIILTVFQDLKIFKTSPLSSNFKLADGDLWSLEAMNNALGRKQ